VSERVSIRNLRAILEALAEWGQKEKDTVLITEYARVALKRQISYQHCSGNNLLLAYLLAPDVEEMLRAAIRVTSAGSYLALDPAASKRLVASIRETIGNTNRLDPMPVLLTVMDIRRYVRKLIETDLYGVAVLSFQELTAEINVQPMGTIGLARPQ
jgi:type III secretion protein V